MYILRMSEASSPFGKRPAQIAPALLTELAATADAIATSDTASAGPKWGAIRQWVGKRQKGRARGEIARVTFVASG